MRLDICRRHWVSGLVCLMVGLCSAEACSEELIRFMQQAVANREVVAAARTRLAQSRLDVEIGKSPFLPSLDLGYTANRLDESSAFENEENSHLSAALSINLFAGFADRYRLASAEQIQLAREYELQTVIEDLKLAVAVRYLAIFANRQALIVAEDQLSLLKKRYEDAQYRNSVGLIRRNDVLRIKVEMDDAFLVRAKARAEYEKSINLLAFTLGSDVAAAQISFAELNRLPELKDRDAYRNIMMSQRSEIKALEMVVAAREQAALAQRSAYYPRLNVSAGYRHYGDDYVWGTRQGSDGEAEMRLQAQVDLNLFDGFRKGHTVQRFQLDVRKARLDLAELKQLLTTSLENSLLDYGVAVQNLSVARTGIDQAEESLRVVELSFEEGVETATEVLDAILLLSRAKTNFITARSTVFLNYYQILRTIEAFDVLEAPL
ncbi:MAG: TolC family protein [Desulfosarcinaceae bacterium]|nr:TolC family protein [Desulfosarcinaceae bacterium]